MTSLSIKSSRKRRQTENLLASGAFGDVLEIAGSGLSGEVSVFIGGVICEIQSSSENVIECIVGAHEAGDAWINVNVKSNGNANSNLVFQFVLEVNEISPVEGSFAGGQRIQLAGSGFSAFTSYKFCDEPINATEVTAGYVVFITPQKTFSETDVVCSVNVVDGQVDTVSTNTFSYSADFTRQVTKI